MSSELKRALAELGDENLARAVAEALAAKRKQRRRKQMPPCADADCGHMSVRLGSGGVYLCRDHYRKQLDPARAQRKTERRARHKAERKAGMNTNDEDRAVRTGGP